MGNRTSQTHMDSSFPLVDLPEELIVQVLLFVPAKQLLKLRRTCKLFKDIIDTKSLWISKCHKDGVELPPSFYFEKENLLHCLLTPQDFMKISIKCPFERNLLCNWNGEGNVVFFSILGWGWDDKISPAVWLALLKWFTLVFRATLILFFCLKSTLNYLWKFQISCALALANFSLCQSSGPMAQNYCLGITMAYIRCYIPLFGREDWVLRF